MHPARSQFGLRTPMPVVHSDSRPQVPEIKRSHVVTIAAIGFVAVAGTFAIGRVEQPAEIHHKAPQESAPEPSATQPTSGARLPVVIPVIIPNAGSAPAPSSAAAAVSAPAQARPAAPPLPETAQRGGFGDTARSMANAPGRSAVSG